MASLRNLLRTLRTVSGSCISCEVEGIRYAGMVEYIAQLLRLVLAAVDIPLPSQHNKGNSPSLQRGSK